MLLAFMSPVKFSNTVKCRAKFEVLLQNNCRSVAAIKIT